MPTPCGNTLLRSILDEIPDNGELRLAPDEVPADGGGEAGGHAAHLLVAFRKVAINGRMNARDVYCGFETCCHMSHSPKIPKAGPLSVCPSANVSETDKSTSSLETW